MKKSIKILSLCAALVFTFSFSALAKDSLEKGVNFKANKNYVQFIKESKRVFQLLTKRCAAGMGICDTALNKSATKTTAAITICARDGFVSGTCEDARELAKEALDAAIFTCAYEVGPQPDMPTIAVFFRKKLIGFPDVG